MKVAVTGASGFIGSSLARALSQAGYEVCALVRKPRELNTERAFSLGQPCDPSIFDGVDVLVHAAYDFSSRTPEYIAKVNVEGSIELIRTAVNAGVKKIVFISSMSAFDGTPSQYGQGKLLVEKFVSSIPDAVSIRPGSVWSESPQGLIGTLKKVASLPVIPYFGGDSLSLFMVHVDDLCSCIIDVIGTARGDALPSVCSCIGGRVISFKEIMKKLSGKDCPLMIPLPTKILLHVLRVFEAVGMRPPFASDSLVGLMHANKYPLHPIKGTFKPFA